MSTEDAQATFRPGDVLRYVPALTHCREGRAFVQADGSALDTYWRPEGDQDSHRLSAEEMAKAKLCFNVGDYTALDRYTAVSRETWETFHPADRGRITSQHGLQETLFIRRGAVPHLNTQIANAEQRVTRAEAELRNAQHVLGRERLELANLEAKR